MVTFSRFPEVSKEDFKKITGQFNFKEDYKKDIHRYGAETQNCWMKWRECVHSCKFQMAIRYLEDI